MKGIRGALSVKTGATSLIKSEPVVIKILEPLIVIQGWVDAVRRATVHVQNKDRKWLCLWVQQAAFHFQKLSIVKIQDLYLW